MTFLDLFIDMSPVTLSNGSVIVTTLFTLSSQINITEYRSSLLSNVFNVFFDAGYVVDNSSISMYSVLNACCM